MESRKIVKSVSFNTGVEDEAKILNAVRRRNFSKYVKDCLLADIVRKEDEKLVKKAVSPSQVANRDVKDTPLSPSEKLDEMKRQMKKTGSNTSSPKLF